VPCAQHATKNKKRKEENPMTRFTIMRIYEIPADDRIEATDRMLEALELGIEKIITSEISSRKPTMIPAILSRLI
jgi:hypothetical protein